MSTIMKQARLAAAAAALLIAAAAGASDGPGASRGDQANDLGMGEFATSGPALLLLLAVPSNDDCSMATAISGEGTFPFDNTNATTDGVADPACLAFGNAQIDRDLWFCWTAPCTGQVRFDTCGQTGLDTKIAVYDGCACPSGSAILACNDDACDFQSRLAFDAVEGSTYLLRVGVFPGEPGGPGAFSLECLPPENDDCQDAIHLELPAVVAGSTFGATGDPQAFPCGNTDPLTAPGVWYTVTGTGNMLGATFCSANSGADFDTQLSIFCGPCENLTCIAGNDDGPPACGVLSRVPWCSEDGVTYYILVHGYNGETGDFTLEVRDTGNPCMPSVVCDCNANMIPDLEETAPEYDPLAAVAADECENAMCICPGIEYSDTTVGATNSTITWCGLIFGGLNDVFYCYRPKSDSQPGAPASVRVCDSDFDPVITVHSGCPATEENQIACNFASAVGTNCGAIFDVEGGETYYIRVAGQGNQVGGFLLELFGPDCLLNPFDVNENDIPDECECLADVNDDGVVDGEDIQQVIDAQGNSCPCVEDIDSDGDVDDDDLLAVYGSLGPCPVLNAMAQRLHPHRGGGPVTPFSNTADLKPGAFTVSE